MKKLLLIASALVLSLSAFAQAKQPTIMIVPSDTWCKQKGYMHVIDDMGTTKEIPNYEAALLNDMDLRSVMQAISNLMAERGFPLKDLEAVISSLQQDAAENSFLTSKSGNQIAVSDYDRLIQRAKADIIMELSWDVQTMGPKRQVTYILAGKDAYTNKNIGGVSGQGAPSFTADVRTLLLDAVVSNIDEFNSYLQRHFDDLFAKGREVAVDVMVFQDNEAGIDLESEFDGMELIEIIENWMAENTVEHRFSTLEATETHIKFEQVRIPLFNENGMPIDTSRFARQLRNYLKKTYQIDGKVVAKGLGKAIVVIGEK